MSETPEVLTEVTDFYAQAQELVRLGLMPIAQLPFLKRALTQMESGGIVTVANDRNALKLFFDGVMSIALGNPGLYRQIRTQVAQRHEEVQPVEESTPLGKRFRDAQRSGSKDNMAPAKRTDANLKQHHNSLKSLASNHYVSSDPNYSRKIRQNVLKPAARILKREILKRGLSTEEVAVENVAGDTGAPHSHPRSRPVVSPGFLAKARRDMKARAETTAYALDDAKKELDAFMADKKNKKAAARAGFKKMLPASKHTAEELVTEGRIPIKDHPYHAHSDNVLTHIIKDAHEAGKNADEMGDEKGSKKYSDQVCNAATILAYRGRKKKKLTAEQVIAEAIMIKPSHRGLLHKELGVKPGSKIPLKKLEVAKHSSDPAERKRATFALNFGHRHEEVTEGVKKTGTAAEKMASRTRKKERQSEYTANKKIDLAKGREEKYNPYSFKAIGEEQIAEWALTEDVNFRTAPEGQLNALANTVFNKKRAGGVPSKNDKAVASRARAELRRRRNENKKEGTVAESYDQQLQTSLKHFGYTTIADVPAEKVSEFFRHVEHHTQGRE